MPSTEVLARLWPASGVRVRAGDLELRWIDDELLVELAALAGRGIHAPDAMPFEHPWTRGEPDEVARNVLTYQWDVRPRVSPDRFAVELAVLHHGVPVGVQGLTANDWPVLRRVQTGSWLGMAHQGRGIGSRMRVLALHLAFEGLGAREATSGAFADNPASNAVSRRVGYESDGAFMVAREGVAVSHNRYTMSQQRWVELRAPHRALLGAPVELRGVDAFRRQLDQTA
ncbi:GNAT family N-acetyltransferase [Microbacterium allomyrinae]|uniref:GNAT family N-acetyltransferase n=1 Tax=Microbacterium allomyrinae TaxID=2830666 RepID=A0A9X1S1W8_9MICO|nr:GNAT family protein [Microbacterium allomyrinae]MCC2032066.1 GNAT family N-acetyltransferase [Microbacterium allomyrinae]